MNIPQPKLLGDTPYAEMLVGTIEASTSIVLALHWMGGATAMWPLLADCDRPLRVISLQGEYPSGDEEGGYSWYPEEGAFYQRSEKEQAPDIRLQADRIAAFLRQLREAYPARLAVIGMSQGGDLALSLAVHYPELIDMAIPLAGRLSEPMRLANFSRSAARLPIISMKQGLDDPIVSVESARQVLSWLQAAGFSASLQEYANVGHAISKAMIGDLQQDLAKL
jgi:predicted esterase